MTFFDGEVTQAAQLCSTSTGVGIAEITHSTIRELLSDSLDGPLPEADHERVEQHLARCSSCRAYQHTLEATRRALRSVPRASAPGDAKQRLLRLSEDVGGG